MSAEITPVEPAVWPAIILGSGPAGLTAAIYLARADLPSLVLGGPQPGGQLTTTTEVENFPGFPTAITGPELVQNMQQQAERFGTVVKPLIATNVDVTKQPFTVTAGDETFHAKTIVIATGASAMWLNLPAEKRLMGKGVSGCATCDGFFFRGKKIAIVGGGDSAMEEALFLTKFATKVTVIHRRDSFRASKIMAARVMEHPKIEIIWNHQVTDILGDDHVTGLKLKSTVDDSEQTLNVDGVFVAIGHKPNTDMLKDVVELDQKGYIVPQNVTHTNVDGVFVAGDVSDHRYRQAITAAGAGCMAAIDVEKYLTEREEK